MKKLVRLAIIMTVLSFIYLINFSEETDANQQILVVDMRDNLVSIHVENANLIDAIKQLVIATKIKINVLNGVENKKVSLNISNVPISKIGTILKKLSLNNFAISYDPKSIPVPLVPTGVSATDGTYTDRVRISWNTASGATSYEVWRGTTSSTGSATRIAASVTGTTFDDTTGEVGRSYYYWVRSENFYGYSLYSSYDTGWRQEQGINENNTMPWIPLLLLDN